MRQIIICSRREKILEELLSTEEKYVEDLNSVLAGYRDRLESSSIGQKTVAMFGNMEDIYVFHSQCLLPELERCGANTQMIAKIFIDYRDDLNRLYCR